MVAFTDDEDINTSSGDCGGAPAGRDSDGREDDEVQGRTGKAGPLDFVREPGELQRVVGCLLQLRACSLWSQPPNTPDPRELRLQVPFDGDLGILSLP